MDNRVISNIFKEIAVYLEMQDDFFRARAYEKVAEVLDGLEEDVVKTYKKGGLKALEEIPGVGLSIAEKIEELIKTGHLKYYEQLKKKMPVELGELGRVEGLGPKGIKKLYQKLKIKNLKELETAAKSGKIGKLEGFGQKSEQNILKSIEFLNKSGGRFVLGHIINKINEIESRLKKIEGVKKVIAAGSVRRRKETVGDADILVAIDEKKYKSAADKITNFFISMPEVVRVSARGITKSSVKLENGLDVDLRIVPKKSYGAALSYFTGSKDHNVALREIAVKKGWKLNEYGLFAGENMIAGKTEEEIYQKLGMDYIDPELREMTGEIEAAINHKLPSLIGYADLKGDLQVQSDWTDGSDSIEEIANAAIKAGFEYVAITDHTKRLAMTRGLDEKKIQKQWVEIDRVNRKLRIAGRKFKVLKGTECDILKDGSLDLPDKILSKLDVVGVSIHSLFNLSLKEQMERIKKALSNPNVDIFFHPTGRIINKREAYQVDIEELIKLAKEKNVILEINAYPDRADLKDEYIRKCVDGGVKMAIDSDAHSVNHFAYLEFGIAQARRGWATKNDVINAWPLEKMLKFLKD
ncbi:MAG: DNA polymerase (family X) [Parcubacteria group bacterium Athens1014_26]|nr:MAG: DNA polymerase (family X) [Parcubacteria group bacterium Athens1014_26]